MKESYELILKKLTKDLKNFNEEIKDTIDYVEENELYKMRYERLLGAKNYCKDLVEFFEELVKNID